MRNESYFYIWAMVSEKNEAQVKCFKSAENVKRVSFCIAKQKTRITNLAWEMGKRNTGNNVSNTINKTVNCVSAC